MTAVFEARALCKHYGDTIALHNVSLNFPARSVIGLIGRNGSGKTTLMQHMVGFCLPTSGEAETLGCPIDKLGADQLQRTGYVPQQTRFLDWMTVDEQIDYVAAFYPRWDRARETRLRDELDLDGKQYVGALSTGNLQKLALIAGVCHHPDLLIVDEPAASLDPLARAKLLAFLLELIRDDAATIVISSHVLRDIEQVVDHVVCLEAGRVTADEDLDALQERYATWTVTAAGRSLPPRFGERFVLEQEHRGQQALLTVDATSADLERFRKFHAVDVTVRAMNLEALFPLLVARDVQTESLSGGAGSC